MLYIYIRLGQVHHEFFFLSFVLADQVGQIVSDGHVQLVYRTSPEVRASFGQLFELVHGVQVEKVPVHVRVGQIVSRYVGKCAQTLVDVIVLWVFDDVVADGFLVAEECLVVVVRGQIAVHHLGVVSHSNLKIDRNRISNTRFHWNIDTFRYDLTHFRMKNKTKIIQSMDPIIDMNYSFYIGLDNNWSELSTYRESSSTGYFIFDSFVDSRTDVS